MATPRDSHRPRQAFGQEPSLQPTSGTATRRSGPGEPAPEAATRWRDWLLKAALIVLAGLWVYSPVCHPVHHADWLWDDDQLLTANLTVQHRVTPDPSVPPQHLATLAKLWFAPDGADYFPLSYTALWAQWPFFQMDPRTGGPVQPGGPSVPWPTGYHATSVVLHVIGSLLLWRLFAVMKIPGAWFGALLFAVHPVCVESVAWVSELKNTLSMPLFLLSAISYVKFDDAAEKDDWRWLHYVLSLVFFLLAMFAKTSVVAMPVVLLLYAWWKHGRVTVRDVVLAAPFFLISIVLGLVTIWYQHGRAIGQETIIVPPYFANGLPSIRGILSRLAVAGMSLLFYLWTIFWPANLLPIYPRWEIDPPKAWQLLPIPVILGGIWWFWQNRAGWGRHVLFGLGFFLLMVAPVLGFITISYMRITWAADHFIYLPMIGVIALVAALVASWYDRLPASDRPILVAGCAATLAVLTWISYGLAVTWVNEDQLWTHTLQHNENAWQAHNRLGAKKFARGHVDDIPVPSEERLDPATRVKIKGALHHFTRSTALRPDLGETHNNLGTALSAKGRLDEAIEQFKEAVRVTPHVPAIHVNLANALAAGGRFPEAEAKYLELIQGMERAHADAIQATGNPAIPLDPGVAALINNYGVTLFKQGKKDEAIAAFRRALSINPNLKDARDSLAMATGEAAMPPPAAGPAAERGPASAPAPAPPLPMSVPQSPTLGPAAP
jgi:tetratricopeptide (TPR) repeat protein